MCLRCLRRSTTPAGPRHAPATLTVAPRAPTARHTVDAVRRGLFAPGVPGRAYTRLFFRPAVAHAHRLPVPGRVMWREGGGGDDPEGVLRRRVACRGTGQRPGAGQSVMRGMCATHAGCARRAHIHGSHAWPARPAVPTMVRRAGPAHHPHRGGSCSPRATGAILVVTLAEATEATEATEAAEPPRPARPPRPAGPWTSAGPSRPCSPSGRGLAGVPQAGEQGPGVLGVR